MIKSCVNCMYLDDSSTDICEHCDVSLDKWDNEFMPLITDLRRQVKELEAKLLEVSNGTT
jgi:RNA polymerase subunit RPABC4/transcription elongation factor Spt4